MTYREAVMQARGALRAARGLQQQQEQQQNEEDAGALPWTRLMVELPVPPPQTCAPTQAVGG